MDEIVNDFLIESHENLDQLDRDLVDLERDPTDGERLASVFRALHTIKGTSGFLGYPKLQAASHAAESLLARLRSGELVLDASITSGLLAAVDAVREMLAAIEAHGEEGDRDDSALIARLVALTEGTPPPESGPAGPSAAWTSPVTEAPAPWPASTTELSAAWPAATPAASGAGDETTPAAPAAAAPEGAPPEAAAPAVEVPVEVPVAPAAADAGPAEDHAEHQHAENQHAENQHAVRKPAAGADGAEVRGGVADSSVRVDVTVLDRLVNLVGELVLARNQIVQHTTSDNSSAEQVATAQRLDLLISELQGEVMKTRMQAIGTVWTRFPRVVRDLAVTCGKQVRLEMEGTDTELDRTILEAVRDPMLHLLRNSVDHGIEPADVRVAAGKPAEGLLVLRARHEAGHVSIEIVDDGGGIDVERVRAKAIAGERDPDRIAELRTMSNRDVVDLIFSPGLSTATEVTNVSGRGVGMDVVRTHVDRIGGTIEVTTAAGVGTTFKIRLPLTLAIIPALVVNAGGQRYAIPHGNVVELVRVDAAKVATAIEVVAGAQVYRLRGRLLPLVDLGLLLGLPSPRTEGGPVTIVVVHIDGQQFGLIVSGLSDTQEIVVKPLDQVAANIGVFSGATIMGDGGVALILEVNGVAARAGVLTGEPVDDHKAGGYQADSESRRSLLILAAGATHRVALPLDDVERLEQLSAADVERTTNGAIVQYRGQMLPLVSLPGLFGENEGFEGMMRVIVTTITGRQVGLVASRIIDIVDEHVQVERGSTRAGLDGSAIIAGRATELLDVGDLIAAVAPDLLASADTSAAGTKRALAQIGSSR